MNRPIGQYFYKNFNNKDIIEILKEENVKVKTERGNRVFPVSDKSQDVLNAFINRLKKLKVDIRTNCQAESILVKDNKVIGVLTKEKERIEAEKVILATGGKSYPLTGSTGASKTNICIIFIVNSLKSI